MIFRVVLKSLKDVWLQVGGKNAGAGGMTEVPDFIDCLREQSSKLGYDRLAAFFDGDFNTQDKFTALGSIYFVHRSLNNVDIYNFKVIQIRLMIISRLYLVVVLASDAD